MAGEGVRRSGNPFLTFGPLSGEVIAGLRLRHRVFGGFRSIGRSARDAMNLRLRFPFWSSLLLAFTFSLVRVDSAEPVDAATGEGSPGSQLATALETAQTNLKAAESNEEWDADTKTKVVDARKSEVASYESALSFVEQETKFRQSIVSAPERTLELKNSLGSLNSVTVSTNAVLQALAAGMTSEELDHKLAEERASLAQMTSQLKTLEDLVVQRAVRSEALLTRKAEVRASLEEIETAIKTEAGEANGGVLKEAVRSSLLASRAARQAESTMLEQEQLSLPLRAARGVAERDLVQKQIANLKFRVDVLDGRVVQLRREEAKAQERAAEQEKLDAIGKHPLVETLAAEFSVATKLHTETQGQIDGEIKSQLEALASRHEVVQKDYERAKEHIDLVGLSDSFAVLLLEQWRRLPNVRTNQTARAERKNLIGEVGFKRFQAEENLANLPDTRQEETVSSWVRENYKPIASGFDEPEIYVEVERLIESKRSALTTLVADYSRLLQELGKLDFEETKHVTLVEEYTAFLEERLLWIPSSPAVSLETIKDIPRSMRWIGGSRNRSTLSSAFRDLWIDRPLFSGGLIILLLVGLGSRPLVRRKEEAYQKNVRRISTDSFAVTLKATFLLLLQSAPFAAVLALLGRHLVESHAGSEIARALGVSLQYSSIYLFGMLVLMNVCRPKGLGQVHFGWQAPIADLVRKHLLWCVPVVLLTIATADLTEELRDEFHRTGLGRVAIVTLLLSVSILFLRTFRSNDGVLSGVLARAPGGWLFRLRGIWYWGLVLIPIGLALLSVSGYHHTAFQLTRRASITISFFVGAFVVQQLIWRWFVVKERKLQLEKWLEKRRVAAEARAASGEPEETSVPEISEEELDLKSLNEQTRRLLSSLMSFSLLLGVWLIWSDVLPALNVLNAVELWDREVSVDGGAVITEAVTLTHLTLAFLIMIILSVVVRNISGILEIGILQNLPLEAGSRYAIVSVVQYVLVLMGCVAVFNVLGFSLAQFGWMMAALSVGLGFGLQEVVANFVSGVILLAERPIRVGDIVTVSDVTGVVTRIRIRATTITNWDRQELVVPNKEFITGRILNWTLSNTVNRIVITVGVAYGSDTEQARNLLLKVANEHPLIMNDPGPMATFEGFDDSTLRLLLRCYLPNLDNRLSVVHELHTSIDKAFAEAGIEIAFPQRDLNIRSVPAEFVKAQVRAQENPS